MFCRVLRTYGLGYDELLNLSIKRFWFLNRSVDRLKAEDDLRHLQLLASVGSQEGFGKMIDGLQEQIGVIAVQTPAVKTFDADDHAPDPEFDREAFNALRQKMQFGE